MNLLIKFTRTSPSSLNTSVLEEGKTPDATSARLARLLDKLVVVLMIAILLVLSWPVGIVLFQQTRPHTVSTPTIVVQQPIDQGIYLRSSDRANCRQRTPEADIL